MANIPVYNLDKPNEIPEPVLRPVSNEALAYIERIGATHVLKYVNNQAHIIPNRETLYALNTAHVFSVPFENLSMNCVGGKITVNPAAGFNITARPKDFESVRETYEKIVTKKRGGVCFELNGCFAWLLMDLGFTIRTFPSKVNEARVFDQPAWTAPAHHIILTTLPDGQYIVDVGFGKSAVVPMRFVLDEEQVVTETNERRLFKLTKNEENEYFWMQYVEYEHHSMAQGPMPRWEARLAFNFLPWSEEHFFGAFQFVTTNPKAFFTWTILCAIIRYDQEIILRNDTLSITDVKTRSRLEYKVDLDNAEDVYKTLETHFGIPKESLEAPLQMPVPMQLLIANDVLLREKALQTKVDGVAKFVARNVVEAANKLPSAAAAS